MIVSSRVYDRVLAAPEDYPTIVAFYAQLDAQAELVKEFRPGPGETRAGAQALPAVAAPLEPRAGGRRRAGSPPPRAARQRRPLSSPGASPAAASTSPSAIGRRPGRTIA